MAGGNWSPTDMPVLPGFYMNFVAAAQAAITPGSRGVVVIPVKAHWGPVGQFVEVASEPALAEIFTNSESDGATAYTAIRMALLGGARQVLSYRLASAAAATASVILQDTASTSAQVIRLDAKYPGARANDFSITVQTSLVDSSFKDIKLYEGTTLLRTITVPSSGIQIAVDTINDDPNNKWVIATMLSAGSGTLANVAGVTFSGGSSGITGITNADYTAALEAIETQEFNIMSLDGVSDSALQTSVVAWVRRVRSEGKGIVAVLGGPAADDISSSAVSKAIGRSATWNKEGIINVGSGVILDDVSYSSAQAAAYAAGLIAGTPLSAATTYAPTPFDDVTRRWTRSEQEQAVKGGVFLFIHDGRQVKVLRGINSLVTLQQGTANNWKKIRTIAVMDAINSDLQRTAEDNYIGKVNNTEEGKIALIGACKDYLRTLADAGVIESVGYNVIIDPAFPNPEPDQVFLRWEARLTDVMEQIFGTFIVQ